jgi:hypothetical protein
MKNKLKEGMFLIDDEKITYKVIEVFKNSAVVQPIQDIAGDFSCEVMTFQAMENEKWQILKLL